MKDDFRSFPFHTKMASFGMRQSHYTVSFNVLYNNALGHCQDINTDTNFLTREF